MIVHKDTVKAVATILKINYTGYEQDWFVEFADTNRLSEFISVLNNKQLSFPETYAILSIVIASYDEFLYKQKDDNQKIWNEIVKAIDKDKTGYMDILNYWALWNEKDTENIFTITPLIREYLQAY